MVSALPSDVCGLIAKRQERTALNIIGKLCSPKFKRTLHDMANNQRIIQSVQDSFDKLISTLHSYEQ